MIKSIFVDSLKVEGIEDSFANHLIVAQAELNDKAWSRLKKTRCVLSICVSAFGPDGCPANPQAQQKLFKKIIAALTLNPQQLWIDHFRFDGHWESVKGNKIPDVHQGCEWCIGKNRAAILQKVAKKVISLVQRRCEVGYFAVPLKNEEVPNLISELGQDHQLLGKSFAILSPMLYHQMIAKPVSYISEYVSWLSAQTSKPILPIIQIKSMPDVLKDSLDAAEINRAFEEAIKKPSQGVCFFWWTHALEKNKTWLIKKLFTVGKK